MNTPSNIIKKIAKWIGIILLVLIALFAAIVLLIRTPWAQQKITNYATRYVSEKTGTHFDIQRLFLTFSGNVQLEGLYLEDQKKDTLVYLRSLETGVGIRSLFKNHLSISRVDLQGLRAHITRGADSTFNFDFIISAFAGPPDSTSTAKPSDTTSKDLTLSLGPVNLSDLHLTYRDSISGMDASINLGNLDLTTNDLDLEKSRFEINDILLENTSASLRQFLPPPPSPKDTTASTLPYLSLDELQLKNIHLSYHSFYDTIHATAALSNFYIGSSEIDLPQQNISVNAVKLFNSSIRLQLPKAKTDSSTMAATDTVSHQPFQWPAWQLKLGELQLKDDHIDFQTGNVASTEGQFDQDHIMVDSLQLDLEDVSLENHKATANLRNFSFAERSGFELKQLGFELEIDDEKLRLGNLQLITANSTLNANLILAYDDIDSLLAEPLKNSHFALGLGETSLSIKDAFFFSDSLSQDSLMQKIAPYPLRLQGSASGSVADLSLDKFKAQWLNQTELLVNGKIKGLPGRENLQVDIPELTVYTTDKDLSLLADTAGGITFPKYAQLKASLKGDAQNMTANLKLNTPDGDVVLNSQLRDILKIPAYKGNLKVEKLDIGKFSQNPDLQPVSLNLVFNGSGNSLQNLTLTASVFFQQLQFRDYDYKNLKLIADVQDHDATLKASLSDENLDFDLKVNALLDTANTVADLELDLRGADLRDMHLSTNALKTALNLKAHFEGKPDDFKSRLNITRGIFILDDQSYRMDSIFASLQNKSTATNLYVNSEVINGSLQANTSIQTLSTSLKTYLARALNNDSATTDTAYQKLDMTADFNIANSPLLTEIFVPQLNRMDTISLQMAFKPSDNLLIVKLRSPDILYGQSELEQLSLDINAKAASINASLGFDHLKSGPVDISTTQLNLDLKGERGLATLNILDPEQKEVFYTSVEIDKTTQQTRLHVVPEHLTLNSNPWNIDANNEIVFSAKNTLFHNFELSRNAQQISLNSQKQNEVQEMLLAFSNFKLEAIFSILNPRQSPVSGELNGNVKFTDLNSTPAFIADLNLNELGVLGNPIGNLNLKANNRQAHQYELNLALKGEPVDLSLDGTYSTGGNDQNLNMNLDINRLDVSLAEAFFPDKIQSANGSLQGHFDVKGPTSQLNYSGSLQFKNAQLTPTMLGTAFNINNDKIKLDNKGVYFNNFTLVDANGNNTTIDGQVGTESMINPSFDLKIVSHKFQILNSTRKENDLFYGTALIDLDVSLKGDLNLPKVNAQVNLRKGTVINYIVPETQAQIQEREGIVRFANMKDSVDILSNDENQTNTITGLDVSAYLKVDPQTEFNVIIDEQSGDRVNISGEADLNYELHPNGNMALSGSYELRDGSYQLSLYQLVKKKFDIVPGSRIVWNGDPMGARLDLTAVYKVETSAADLMAYQLADADPNTLNKYKQKIPFEVMLYIKGDLRKPQISFGLDMPDNSKDVLGGNVYARVQQLNEDESELNKQVVALIVFNRFLPSDAVNTGGGGASELARSSVSKLLSNQLNQLSQKYIQGFELNFDLNSYTDYQTGQADQRTDLNVSLRKSLFGDRVVVQVGSQVGIEGQERQSNEIIGDISLEYLIDPDGTYRLKAFRKNQYQDLVEGQLTVTGLSILFNKEFDTLKELLEKQKEKAKNEEKQDNSGRE